MANNANPKKKGAAYEATPAKSVNANDTSTNNQHQIILSALRERPQSTIDLRHGHGIMQPAPRIKELRVSNSIQYFPLISVQLFPLFCLVEHGFCDA